jgi:RNA polymerase sigma-70 factor (ECF subfamily)
VDPVPPADSRPDGDGDLVDRLRAGDEAAFTRLVDGWSGAMLRLATSYVVGASAEEVVQDTWLAVIEHLDEFEGRSSLKHWVFRILANTAKRRAARDRRVLPVGDPGAEIGPTVDPDRFAGTGAFFPGHWRENPSAWHTPEHAAETAELRRVVADAVGRLPPRQAAVVTLRDVEGFEADEVAKLMGVSVANQRVLLHRGRASVRAALEEYLAGGVTAGPPHDSGRT